MELRRYNASPLCYEYAQVLGQANPTDNQLLHPLRREPTYTIYSVGLLSVSDNTYYVK